PAHSALYTLSLHDALPISIEIAVINLVDNALKYAPDGKRVAISVARTARQLEVRVTDEGPGIPNDDKKRIFERFFRGKSATQKRDRKSTRLNSSHVKISYA